MPVEHHSNCTFNNVVTVAEQEQAAARAQVFASSMRWLPWVGANYGNNELYRDKRILVVGDSHYEWCARCSDEHRDRPADLTCRVVAEHITRPAAESIQHWRNIEYALRGGIKLEGHDRRRFWHSIAYYNYIQEIVGYVPAGRRAPKPRKRMYEAAKPVFMRVIESLTPHFVIVLGLGMWTRLPDEGPQGALPSLQVGGREIRRCKYSLGEHTVLACSVRHPAAGLGAPWNPVLSRFLEGREFA